MCEGAFSAEVDEDCKGLWNWRAPIENSYTNPIVRIIKKMIPIQKPYVDIW